MLQGTSQVVLVVKNPPANAGDVRDMSSIPGSGRSPEGGWWQTTPVFLPGKSHDQKTLVGCKGVHGVTKIWDVQKEDTGLVYFQPLCGYVI